MHKNIRKIMDDFNALPKKKRTVKIKGNKEPITIMQIDYNVLMLSTGMVFMTLYIRGIPNDPKFENRGGLYSMLSAVRMCSHELDGFTGKASDLDLAYTVKRFKNYIKGNRK